MLNHSRAPQFHLLAVYHVPMKTIIALLVIALILLGAFLLLQEPRNDRAWDEGFSRLVTIETAEDGAMTFRNVRDFTYDGTEAVYRNWKDVTIDPRDITGAWFFLNAFSSFKQVGHTFISFDFKDGSTMALSIEARREQGEEYTFIGGFLRQYELQYIWGMERDFIPERLVYRRHPVEMYRLSISPEDAQALFRSFAAETNDLSTSPRFYHTLLANCTNLLAKMTNEYYPGTLPYHLAWNLTGLSPAYLMQEGYIAPYEAGAADLTRYREEIARVATSSPEAFSASIRVLLQKKDSFMKASELGE